MAVDEQAKLAYASTAELTKQLLTLATGILTLEVTFAKAFFDKVIAKHWQLQASWILFILSIFAGVWLMMALTGSLAQNATLAAKDVYQPNTRLPAFAQVVTFMLGMAMTVWFGLIVSV